MWFSKRHIPLVAATALLAAVAVFGYLQPGTTSQVPVRLRLDNKGGTVLFTHQEHGQAFAVECGACHHTTPALAPVSAEGASVNPCGACHPPAFDEAYLAGHMEAFADQRSCLSCHHTNYGGLHFDHDGHIESYGGDDCQQCHHGPDISPEPMACDTCHGDHDAGPVVSLAKANHEVCGRCHGDTFTDRPYKLTSCGYCHIPADPATDDLEFKPCGQCHTQKVDELMPLRSKAFHGQCMGCHEARNKGPFGNDACGQCHLD